MYKQKIISIDNFSDIQDLVNEASKVEDDIYVLRNSFKIDAKSFLGVISIDPSKSFTISYPRYAKDFENFISYFED